MRNFNQRKNDDVRGYGPGESFKGKKQKPSKKQKRPGKSKRNQKTKKSKK